jgi:hypothetical protein
VALDEGLACRLATPHMPGAFRCGLRLMAIAGTVEDVPAIAAFGLPPGRHGDSALPPVQGGSLVACGTRAIVDATLWPYGTSERVGAAALLRAVSADMLVLWERGLHAYDRWLWCASAALMPWGTCPPPSRRRGALPCLTARPWTLYSFFERYRG